VRVAGRLLRLASTSSSPDLFCARVAIARKVQTWNGQCKTVRTGRDSVDPASAREARDRAPAARVPAVPAARARAVRARAAPAHQAQAARPSGSQRANWPTGCLRHGPCSGAPTTAAKSCVATTSSSRRVHSLTTLALDRSPAGGPTSLALRVSPQLVKPSIELGG
jgi:hypothetical protein